MSAFDSFDTFKYYFGRYLWPSLFLILGLFLLKLAVVPEMHTLNTDEVIPVTQNSMFRYAALFFVGASIVWFLYLLGVVKAGISYIVMGVMAIASIWLIYADYNEVATTVSFIADYESRDLEIKTRMNDLKQAELAYKETNGSYTNSADDLIDFVKNGKKMKIKKEGSVPERKITVEERDYLYDDKRPIDKLMTEKEAALLAISPIAAPDLKKFVRDTNYISVMDAIFREEKYLENREKIGGVFEFNADSLKYVPYTRTLVKIDTSFITKGELTLPTLRIQMDHPMKDNPMRLEIDSDTTYVIGDINDNNLRESWKDK